MGLPSGIVWGGRDFCWGCFAFLLALLFRFLSNATRIFLNAMAQKKKTKPRAQPKLPLVPRTERDPFCEEFRCLLEQERKALALSLLEMVRRTGYTAKGVAKVELGEMVPTVDFASRLARSIGYCLKVVRIKTR